MPAATETTLQSPPANVERPGIKVPAIFGEDADVEKFDGPLARLVAMEETPDEQILELTVRCKSEHLSDTKGFIEGPLKGKVVDSVRWGSRGEILHTSVAFGRIKALAKHRGVASMGLLRYFDVRR